jgi:nucleotidyltransferase-like protein
MMGRSPALNRLEKQAAIDEITRRLVEYYHPLRIYLFGSEARGDAGSDSDLDFCVVLPDEAPPSLYGPGVYRTLWGVGTAADVIRYPLTEFETRAAHVVSSLPATVLREGRLLYDAGRVA